jgi:hypothetical protein
LSTGGGPNSEIAKLSIGIEATGADAATQKLKDVEQQAKQTAAAVQTSSSISGPGFTNVSSSISLPGMPQTAGSAATEKATTAAAVAVDGISSATDKLNEKTTGWVEKIKSATAPMFSVISLVSRFAGLVGIAAAAYQSIQALQEKVNEYAKKHKEDQEALNALLEKRQVILGRVIELEGDKRRAALIESQQEEIKRITETSANAVWLQNKLQELKIQHAQELAALDAQLAEETQSKIRELRYKTYHNAVAETEKLEAEVRRQRMTEEEKIDDVLGDRRLELNRKLLQEQDPMVQELYERQIEAEEKLAEFQKQKIREKKAAEEAATAERQKKEEEAAKERKQKEIEAANAAAEAYSAAIESASRSATDALRSQLDISGISTQLEGVTDLLDMIARQRGVR